MKYARLHHYSQRSNARLSHKNEGRYKRRSKTNKHSSFKFYLAILSILVSCALYVKYQSVYVEDSLFYNLYQFALKPKLEKWELIKESVSATTKAKPQKPAPSKNQPSTPPQKSLSTKSTLGTSDALDSAKSKDSKVQNTALRDNKPVSKTSRTSPPSRSRDRPQFANRPASTSPTTSVGRQKAFYYLVKTKPDSHLLQLSPKQGSIISLSKNDHYYNLVSKLIEYKSDDNVSLSVFSPKVVLLKSWVEQDTLLLDFNENFQFSRLGDKGIVLQIQQILWTVFRNNPLKVRYVSFLIAGKRKFQIGGHGIQMKPFYSEKDLVRVINFPRKIH